MTFTYPLGLLGLVAIPIIILIYILESKYTEQTVSSTYIWELSEKFLKKKNPLSGLAGIISLILQILTVLAVSLAIAHPVFTVPNSAYDYCFILDASSSMSTSSGRSTRFDLAKDEIEDVIRDAKGGSSYTLVTVSGETVTIFSGVTSKDTAIKLLRTADVSDTHAEHGDLLLAAEEQFFENSSMHMYLMTDKSYLKHDNIEVVTVGKSGDNYALFDLSHSHSAGKLKVSASVISYLSDTELEIKLTVDKAEALRKSIEVKCGELTPIEVEYTVGKYDTVTLEIVTEDGYMLDNSVTAYNLESEDAAYSTLIVSEREFFLKAVIDALTDSEITVVTPEKYESITAKYGLYVFDSYVPDELPDGAVWLVNADKSVPDSGFGVRGVTELPREDKIEKSNGTSTSVRKLLDGVDGDEIYVSRYVKYSGMYLNFATLFTYDSSPLIFAGTNGLGNRQVVIGFDLHDSDFALTSDFIILASNLLEYTFPDVVDNSVYTVGDEVMINILAGADSYRAESPSGKDIYVDMSSASTGILLDEVGTYSVTVTLAGQEILYRLYSSADPDESAPVSENDDFSLAGERTYVNRDGEYDPLVLLFILIAILFIADWGVYCYEKYQLR